VALVGHAYPKHGRGRTSDVGLQVGNLRKLVRVIGERRWVRSAAAWVVSGPIDFERMPLRWERDFGGRDETGPDKTKHSFEARNPVGTGFAVAQTRERLQGLPLPSIEDPRDPMTTWDSRPVPAGFGFVAPSWVPRCTLAGTYDEAWRKSRFPLLPRNFDERFHNAAVTDLVARPHLVGGEMVAVVGASTEGELVFPLPFVRLLATAWIRGKATTQRPVLDTIVIEPDEHRVSLTWRASFACLRRFLHIEAVMIRAEGLP
jgi:hypothetical protein